MVLLFVFVYGMLLGAHVDRVHAPPAAPLAAHLRAADAWLRRETGRGLAAAAAFVAGPRRLALALDAAAEADCAAFFAASGAVGLAHSAYVASPWGAHPPLPFIAAELASARRAGFAGLVVHLPAAPAAAAVPRLAALARLVASDGGDGVIYLETPAVAPAHAHYHSAEALAVLFAALRAELGPAHDRRFGLCVDTAHLWCAGVSLRRRAEARAWLAPLGALADRLALPLAFHLNDAATPLGTGPDTHAALGRGYLWGASGGAGAPDDTGGLAQVLAFAAARGLPLILERKPASDLLADYATVARHFPEMGPV